MITQLSKLRSWRSSGMGSSLLLLLALSSFVSIERAHALSADNSSSAPIIDVPSETTYETKFVAVNGSQMAYVEAGEGAPILFIHGNLLRNTFGAM